MQYQRGLATEKHYKKLHQQFLVNLSGSKSMFGNHPDIFHSFIFTVNIYRHVSTDSICKNFVNLIQRLCLFNKQAKNYSSFVLQSQHYQNTNNASFVVYVIQSQHYQNTNNASFVVYILVLKNCRHLYLDKLQNLPVRQTCLQDAYSMPINIYSVL